VQKAAPFLQKLMLTL